MGPNAMVFLLVMSVHRGDMLPQHSLPYLDALPLDYPHRQEIISKYTAKANRERKWEGTADFWAYREGTRLFLQDQPLDNTDATAYLHGLIMGRHYLWQPIAHDCTWSWGWLDSHWLRLQEEANRAKPEPIPAPQQN